MQTHTSRIATVVLLVGSSAFLFLFGIVGAGRGDGAINTDGRVLYAAGKTWLQHDNPYNHETLARSVASIPGMDLSEVGFFYPPQAALFCTILGLMPYDLARIVWLLANLAAIGALIAMAAVMIRPHLDERSDLLQNLGFPIITATILASPFTAHVLWMGQTTLVAVAALVGTWLYTERNRWLVAGVCLGIASYKPQISILIILWLLLEKDWRSLLTAFITAVAMALYPMATQGGPIGALLAWVNGINSDYALPFNLPSFSHKIGIDSLLVAMGGNSLPDKAITATSLLLTVLLWCFRRRFARNDILALLMIITLTFSVYLHDYDYVALIPVYASMWRLSRRSHHYAAACILLVAILFIPQRLIRLLGIPLLEQWRTLIVLLIGAMILYVAAATRRRQTGSAMQIGAHI